MWYPYYQCTGLWFLRATFHIWPDQCVVFLGKTLHSYSASPKEDKWVQVNCQGSLRKPEEVLGKRGVVTCHGLPPHPRGVAILQATLSMKINKFQQIRADLTSSHRQDSQLMSHFNLIACCFLPEDYSLPAITMYTFLLIQY